MSRGQASRSAIVSWGGEEDTLASHRSRLHTGFAGFAGSGRPSAPVLAPLAGGWPGRVGGGKTRQTRNPQKILTLSIHAHYTTRVRCTVAEVCSLLTSGFSTHTTTALTVLASEMWGLASLTVTRLSRALR